MKDEGCLDLQRVEKGVDGKKSEKMSDEDREELEEKAASAIHLTLHKDVLFNVMEIESNSELWAKLDTWQNLRQKCCF